MKAQYPLLPQVPPQPGSPARTPWEAEAGGFEFAAQPRGGREEEGFMQGAKHIFISRKVGRLLLDTFLVGLLLGK